VTTPDQPGQWPNQQQPGEWPQQPTGQWPQQPGQQPGQWPQQQPGQWQHQPGQWPQQQPQQPYYQQQPGYPPPPPPRKSRRGLIIGLVVALVALVGGGVTWLALAQNDSGSATPTEAALKLASSVGNGDVVGVLGSLAPAEAALFTDPVQEVTNELKRLNVLDGSADPKSLSGIQIKTDHLAFDEAAAQQVNDHVTITKLVSGTITLTGDFGKLPLAKQFLDAALPGNAQQQMNQGPQTRTIDIAQEVRRAGEPFRIATVKVNGAWYPSLLYTVADYALRGSGEDWPATSIPAAGAASANDAVKQMVQAALDADVTRVIELLPPDEMSVLHDAGPAIVKALGTEATPSGAKILDLQTQSSSANGATRTTLTALRLQDPSGTVYSVIKAGPCYQMTAEGQSQQLCAEDLARNVRNQVRSSMPAGMSDVLQHLSTGVLQQGVGVITTQVDGRYYVSPIRTVVEQGMTVLRSLQPGDITTLLKYAN
jgi:hypothetical protein